MKIKIPILIIELEPGNFHLIIKSSFSDSGLESWVIDTGASKSVFDKNLSEKYSVSKDEKEEIHSAGIGEKPLETTIGYLNQFSIGKLKVKSLKVALLD